MYRFLGLPSARMAATRRVPHTFRRIDSIKRRRALGVDLKTPAASINRLQSSAGIVAAISLEVTCRMTTNKILDLSDFFFANYRIYFLESKIQFLTTIDYRSTHWTLVVLQSVRASGTNTSMSTRNQSVVNFSRPTHAALCAWLLFFERLVR